MSVLVCFTKGSVDNTEEWWKLQSSFILGPRVPRPYPKPSADDRSLDLLTNWAILNEIALVSLNQQ